MEHLNSEIQALPEPEEGKGAVEGRQDRQKEALVEQLKKLPIVQAACERVGIARATFYRWKKDDRNFAEAVEQAVNDGTALMNDLAESQLLSCIKDREFSAIAFWLKSRHPAYATKLEVKAKLENNDEALTPEQEQLVRKALELAALGGSDADTSKQSPAGPDKPDGERPQA